MRNLKKLLALVLAMIMAFSLMMTANAATVKFEDYPDKDSITDEFVEGVQVLTGLKVFQGDEKGFRPSDTITRAEAAAIVYRMATGDVEDRQTQLYSDYSTFSDVKSSDWFAGYVGYCQNAGYIKGTSPTTFNPYGKVTGYEALAMILRVVGYGQNNEFVGSQWQVNVAALSRQLGVTKNVTAAHMESTLNMDAPREVVADLIFMTATIVPTVTYTPALAYNDKTTLLGTAEFNPTLGQKIFGLWYETNWTVSDDWGRPGYSWYKNGARAGLTDSTNGKAYMVKENHPRYSGSTATANKVATIMAVPDYETKEQVRECDVAQALDIDTSDTFDLFVNSKTRTAEDYQIVATDTVTKVGGQGRVTEFYYKEESPWFSSKINAAIMIDTMLTQVTGKRSAKLDAAGHVITPAQLDVIIYDGPSKTSASAVAANNYTSTIIYKNDDTDWDEYDVGDMILIHAYTKQNDGTVNDHGTAITDSRREKAAFETNKVQVTNNRLVNKSTVWVEKVADVKQAKQTVTYWNIGKHNVDGTDVPDQLTLFLDKAGSNVNTTYNWYFDLYGNIIGIGDATSSNFGVITSVYAAINQGDSSTTGTTKAIATVKYADGTVDTVEIDRFLMSSNVANDGATLAGSIRATAGSQLTSGLNTVDLRPKYNVDGQSPMTATDPMTAFTPSGAESDGYVYMSTDASRNKDGHFYNSTSFNGDGTNSTDNYQILWDNLFKFVSASDNSVVAVEVAGASSNTDSWSGLRNATTDATYGGMIYKNASFLTLNTTNNNAGDANIGNVGAANVYLDNDTQIMVRTGVTASSSSITTYDGVNSLPGNVKIVENTEVDWADTDGDGRADYVYVTGSATGVVTYGLFYYNGYNGGTAKWDNNSGTINGYLNGEAYTALFNSRSLFDAVNNSANYNGHLFALQISGGAVTGVMVDSTNGAQLLNDGSNSTNISVNDFANNVTVSGTGFGLGSSYGNTYSATTNAIYFDSKNGNASATTTDLHYYYDNNTAGGRTIQVTGAVTATYWLTPDCKVIGELEWLNIRDCDVTMVYENTGTQLAVTTIYITTDPDWTPDSSKVGTITTNGGAGQNVTDIGIILVSDINLTKGVNYTTCTIEVYDFNTGALVVKGNGSASAGSSTDPDLAAGTPATIYVSNNSSTSGNVGDYSVRVTYKNNNTVVAQSGLMNISIR